MIQQQQQQQKMKGMRLYIKNQYFCPVLNQLNNSQYPTGGVYKREWGWNGGFEKLFIQAKIYL
jgi:hypothetical protein